MADITLHSGSFCDRNNNEISITFFKRTSTPVMTVDPTALSFTSNGGTKQLRVSNYTGTLSISVSGGTGWLSRTQSTSSGVRTYTFTATANTATTMRNATITLTDSNSTVTVGVTQAGAVSNVTVNPNYLVFNKNGETKTTTVTWTGGSTPTWSNTPEWASITSSVSGNTMTLTINVGQNTTQYQRTGMVYITNGISRADLSLEQEAVHTVSVQPSSFTFQASGGTQVLTISDIQGSFSMNYEGDGLSVVLLDYPSSTSRRYNVTYTPNTVTSTRTGVINVSDTAGGWVAVTTTQAANTDTFAVSPTSFQYGGTGSTNTFTFTGVPAAGISYDIPSGVDWVTVSNLTNASVDITTAANQSPTSRTTTVKFYDMDDIDNYVTVIVNQEAGQSSLSVVPSSITYLPAGGTSGITATWTAGTEPTATIRYVQGNPGWMTPTGSGTVTGNTKEWAWTASSNYDSSSRTALITVTNGLQSEYVTVSQSSGPAPAVFSVTPSTVQVGASGQATQVTITGAPSNMSYDVTYGSGTDWTHISNFSQTGATLVISANTTASQRTATVKFYDQDDMDNYVTVTITQEGATPTLSVSPMSITYVPAGGTNGITATWTIVEPTVTLTYVDGTGGWLTPTGNGTVNGNTKEWAWTASSNYTGSSRTARVDVTNGTDTYAVAISQASGSESFVVEPSSFSFSANSQNTSLTATYTGPSTIVIGGYVTDSSNHTWIDISRTSGYGDNPATFAVTVKPNVFSSTSRDASLSIYGGSYSSNVPVTQAVAPSASSTFTVNPSDTLYLNRAGIPASSVTVSSISMDDLSCITDSSIFSANIIHGSQGDYINVTAGTNTGGNNRYGNLCIYDKNDVANRVMISLRQINSTPNIKPNTMNFSSVSGSAGFVGKTYGYSATPNAPSISYSGSSTGWVSSRFNGTPGYDFTGTITVASNSGTDRSATLTYYDSGGEFLGVIRVNQEGIPASSISVTPSSIDFPYTNDAETLTVSGVPSGGYSTSISYNTGASGWLGTTNTAYNIIVTASGTTYPSSRTATLTVTNASVPSDSVAIPITQAGNPQVLSVTPNAWNYPASLSYHNFEITYNASGSVTYSVAYDRQPGEEEIDWLEVELVEHEEGSETWIYSIDVGPNNTGSGRAAMVTFEGDGGGADEVSVYQQP